MSDGMKTLSLSEAAKFLGIHKETARQLVASHKLPGAKVGRSCRFLEQDLAVYLRSLYSDSASQGVSHGSKKIWHSTKETKSIGLISTTTVKEYNEALGLAIS